MKIAIESKSEDKLLTLDAFAEMIDFDTKFNELKAYKNEKDSEGKFFEEFC